jgi:hypothetical protein
MIDGLNHGQTGPLVGLEHAADVGERIRRDGDYDTDGKFIPATENVGVRTRRRVRGDPTG